MHRLIFGRQQYYSSPEGSNFYPKVDLLSFVPVLDGIAMNHGQLKQDLMVILPKKTVQTANDP